MVTADAMLVSLRRRGLRGLCFLRGRCFLCDFFRSFLCFGLLDLELREIDARRREPTGRARLEPCEPEAERLEGSAHAGRRALPRPAAAGAGDAGEASADL